MTTDTDPLPLDRGLFGRLRRDAGAAWEGYVAHEFVRALGAGTLPERAFRHFLIQDYLFLIHFARAHALACFKSATLADIRANAAAVTAIVDVEMPLHISYCAKWGLSEAQMEAAPEAMETMAYTRFVLERGLAGDLLDLQAALAPCLMGYGEAAERLIRDPATRLDGNPYAEWIAAYTSDGYRGGRARRDRRRWTGSARRMARRRATRHCARPSPPPRASKPRSGTWAGRRGSDRMRTDITGPTSRIYFSQRLRLHYVDWGNPDAPPLLLLHGGRDHCRNWDWVADALRGEWHVIAPDLRGHGDSAWSQAGNYTMAAYIYDLAQLVHQQKLAPVTIVAHSLGGNIALRYAGLYPENVAQAGRDRGAGPVATADRASKPASASSSGCAPGSTSSAAWPAGCRAATPRIEDGARAHAGGERAPLARAGAAPHAARRQPERGRHL